MSDLVVTVPQDQWFNWLAEGDLPGTPWSGLESGFYLTGRPPLIREGERVYVVCRGRLRGYAPLTRIAHTAYGFELVRRGGAVAMTIAASIPGFRGWRKRWWSRSEEMPFPEWRAA